MSIILNQREKAINIMAPSSVSPEEKVEFPSADKVNIAAFWDCGGVILVDALLRGETTRYLQQDADRTQELFQMSLTSQEFNINLASE